MNLKHNQILKRKDSKLSKPSLVRVLTKDCESEWLIRLQKENDTCFIMHKATIPMFYEPIENGSQTILFPFKTYIDRLKDKYLK